MKVSSYRHRKIMRSIHSLTQILHTWFETVTVVPPALLLCLETPTFFVAHPRYSQGPSSQVPTPPAPHSNHHLMHAACSPFPSAISASLPRAPCWNHFLEQWQEYSTKWVCIIKTIVWDSCVATQCPQVPVCALPLHASEVYEHLYSSMGTTR